MPAFQPVTVTAVRPEGEGAVALVLDAPGYDWTPGQYLTLRLQIGGQEVRRSYSIATLPGEPLTVGVRAVPGGVFSTVAQGLQPGDLLEAMPPEGRFVYSGQSRLLLIAAGSGITPMVSIAGAALAAGAEVTLIYGNRDSSTIMFRDALDHLKDEHIDRFAVLHCLSRETQDAVLLNGRITGDKLRALAQGGVVDPLGAEGVFLCGPQEMIADCTEALTGMGVAPERLHHELFFTGYAPRPARSDAARAAATDGVQVEIVLDGGVQRFTMGPQDDTVLDAAERAGLDLPWSCRGGMCCTCRCKVLDGTSEMAVNYSLDPWELDQNFTLACQTRPTGARLVLDFDAA